MEEFQYDSGLLEYLGQYVTDHKKQLIEKVLSQRTRQITVVLENIYKPHNASAVIRTCDCFGVQDVHVIEKTDSYKINPYVTRGAGQWIDLHKYNDSEASSVDICFDSLRSKDYKIFGTSPDIHSIPISDLKPEGKIALVFGNEHEGISQEVKDKADGLVHIPMLGFTESFNISVSASIFLYQILQNSNISASTDFFISEQEKNNLRMKWYREIVKRSDLHEKKYWEMVKKNPQ